MFVEHIAANGVVFWVSRLEEEAAEAVAGEDQRNIWLYNINVLILSIVLTMISKFLLLSGFIKLDK